MERYRRLISIAAQHFRTVASRCGASTRLNFSINHIRYEGARALLRAISEEAPHSHALYLGNNQIGISVVYSLASMRRCCCLSLVTTT